LAYKPGDHQALRKALFPSKILSDGFVADTPPETSWRIGDSLSLWGPLGKGFTPPAESDKWLLACFETLPDRILSLVQLGLERGAAISLFSEHLPAYLPPQVEWISEVNHALAWADYLALNLPIESIPSLPSRLGIPKGDEPSIPVQVLITQPMPCGLGVCYACAVKGAYKPILACTEGPVFEFHQLEF
jgi:dihydroorotate dehydrogenase electron transfer subunit